MVHWMRKYKKWIFGGIALVTVPTFVYWGTPLGSGGNGGDAEQQMEPVAVVAGAPILKAEYQRRLLNEAERRAQYGGKRPELAELAADGTAERVLDSMISSRLFDMEVRKQNFDIREDFIIERLKESDQFKDENGAFSPDIWNSWIESERHRNWNEIYESVRQEMARDMLVKQVTAPARVLDSELREQFTDNSTKLQIKYVTIDPKIEPTDEQIKAEYDKQPEKYQIPEKRTVDYIAVSLEPPRPAKVDEAMTRLRNGEDFAEVAKQVSESPSAAEGGAMGWISEGNLTENLQVLFKTPVGQFSEPVLWQSVYYIYKAEEEKSDETSGQRSINAREIMIPARLDDAERAARMEKATALVEKAAAAKDIKAAAAEAGLTVQSAADVSVKSDTIAGLADSDVHPFKTALSEVPQGEISDVIEGMANLYVAQVTAIVPPVIQPLEAVRAEVQEDAVETIRRSPERKAELKALGDKIAEQAKSLQEVADKFPELALEIKETQEFSRREYLFQQGVFLQTVDIYGAVGRKEPGAFAGPLPGFRAELYFIELTKKTPPTDEQWANEWPKESDKLRKAALEAKRTQLIMDYLADLEDKAAKAGQIQIDYDAIKDITNPPVEEEPPAEEPVPAAAPAAAAPAPETAPAGAGS